MNDCVVSVSRGRKINVASHENKSNGVWLKRLFIIGSQFYAVLFIIKKVVVTGYTDYSQWNLQVIICQFSSF